MILQNFKKIAQRAAELCAILLFLYLTLNDIANGTATQCRHAGRLEVFVFEAPKKTSKVQISVSFVLTRSSAIANKPPDARSALW